MVCVKVIMLSGNPQLKDWQLWPTIGSFWPLPLYWQKSHFHLFCCWSSLLSKEWEGHFWGWLSSCMLKELIYGNNVMLLDFLEFTMSDPKIGFLNTMKKCLIKHVLETCCLDFGMANRKFTPTKGKTPVKYVHGENASDSYNHSKGWNAFVPWWTHVLWNYLFCRWWQ